MGTKLKMDTLNWRVLFCILEFTLLTRESVATLTITQGRTVITPELRIVDDYPVVGIATVELDQTNPITYYFDCTTNLNNGSGLRWTRQTTPHHFPTSPLGGSRLRLDATGISHSDLDVYICSDSLSSDVVTIEITDSNPAIMAAEEIVQVVQGLTAGLKVYASGYPLPAGSDITWRRPDSSIVTQTDPGGTLQDGEKRLILSNVQSNQAGRYTCTVVIAGNSASVGIQLEVFVPPVITVQPQAIVDATEWSEVRLTCVASGIPIPRIEWEREGGVPLSAGVERSPISMTENTTTVQLIFKKVRYDDRGRYRCIADNVYTNPVVSQYADVRVTPALELRSTNNDQTATSQIVNDLYFVEEETKVSLECFGTGSLSWTSSTGMEIEFDESENIYQSYDQTRDALELTIKNFTSLTTDVYTCTTDLTDALNNPITVSVFITSSNPAVIFRSKIQYVLVGNSTTLEARVYASPYDMADVTWYLEDRLIDDANDNQYTASSEGDIYRLEVNSVSESELRNYTVVVTLNGMSATDYLQLKKYIRPTAVITPSLVTVNEGEELRLFCEARGSGELTVSWTMVDGSPLPLGVQENGNNILISSATRSHTGTYICTVSNLAGTSQDEVIVNVFYPPTVVISYNNQLTSMPSQPLYLDFDHGAMGPTILCLADGYLPPTLVWIQEYGRGLPHGIFQRTLSTGGLELRWQREMEFTDSGSYICEASNQNGNSSATLQVLVKVDPSITSIYPFSSSIKGEPEASSYTVPLKYVGSTVVCVASGWPAPEVEWWKDGQPIPTSDGVVSEMVSMSSTVSAKLTWTRQFQNSDSGSYECVVRKPNTALPLTSQMVVLRARNSTEVEQPKLCSLNKLLVFFQIRVLGTHCQSIQTVDGFHSELVSIITTECGCEVSESELVVLGSPQCSSKVDGAVVFRGQIETGSQARTEEIFCSLSSWQQRSPLIRINNQFRAVDSSCSLEASSSITAEECVAPSASGFGRTEIASTVSVAVILLLLLIVLVITSLICCCHKKRKQNTRVHMDNHTYSTTQHFSRRSQDSVTNTGAYSTLSVGARNNSRHRFEEIIALNHIQSESRENLIAYEGIDGPELGRFRSRLPRNYEIPISSQENLASSSLDVSTSHFQETSQSSFNRFSRGVETCPVPTSSSRDGPSVSNQRNTRKNMLTLSLTSSLHDITSPNRVHMKSSQLSLASFQRVGSNHSPTSGSTGSLSPQAMKQALTAQLQLPDNVTSQRRRKSNCSEAPPPYSSRPTSEQILDSNSDNSSMIYNRAYERTNHHRSQEGNLSMDSSSRPSPYSGASSTAREGTHAYSVTQNGQRSGLISTHGAATCSTLC